jgi:hypothetical protein
MPKTRSARGEVVDFDLIQIKQDIASGPRPVNVSSREEFIDRRVRRRAKKATVVEEIVADSVEEEVVQEQQPEVLAAIEPTPTPVVETADDEEPLDFDETELPEEVVEEPKAEEQAPATKRKARKIKK